MHVIQARNVNDAWYKCLEYFQAPEHPATYARRPSRNGDVLVAPGPVATVYEQPTERVLFDPVRDANPIFHLHEALWMLAGRDDATWLDQFVGDFSRRYAEDGGRMHGAYGRRWRDWFGETPEQRSRNSMGDPIDQLDEVVRILRNDPYDRQAVIQMWDATTDLCARAQTSAQRGLRDKPCNTQIYLRADRVIEHAGDGAGSGRPMLGYLHALDMTVCCRSNDVVFGCYGANVVHMSVLQEYLAARMGCGVGTYTQMSNNWHMYESSRRQADPTSAAENLARRGGDRYPGTCPLVDDPATFDEECRAYVNAPTDFQDGPPRKNGFFRHVALPMWEVNEYRRAGDWSRALYTAKNMIMAPDWRLATAEWLLRRRPK